ncbi:protein kinase domain-containing protein [Corynebacterium mayonis]|uniref:protein kinase domain-containing protein n=1 Tax=Corynebacterium mayonis TaxID=3062461 RepID=UPI003140B0D4
MAQLAVGSYLEDRYVIDRPIARGGMSTVYRCVDTRLDREVAAKVMDERYVHDRTFRERFRREALAMAKLNHPNLVNVYDFSAEGDNPAQVFLIMELITGGTLRELLAERGPMPPHAAAAVMRAVLTGLSLAHRRGMVHRDIKPDNVLINSDHSVKLADFGLVRAAADSPQSTDQIIGTVSYLSPEQVDGSSLTQASDVYSAGIVLFELLTGETPFSGDTPLAHAYARLNEDVASPSSKITGVPKLFDELVATATSRQPRDRFHDAGEFLAALDDVARELALPDYTVPVPTNSAANRAAAHPTSVTAASAASALTEVQPGRELDPQPIPETRVFEQRLFPNVTPAPETALAGAETAPAAAPVPRVDAPSAPAVRQQPDPPAPRPVNPVTNRSAAGLVVFLVFAGLFIVAVLVGAWWFGSGMYDTTPELIAPMRAATPL